VIAAEGEVRCKRTGGGCSFRDEQDAAAGMNIGSTYRLSRVDMSHQQTAHTCKLCTSGQYSRMEFKEPLYSVRLDIVSLPDRAIPTEENEIIKRSM